MVDWIPPQVADYKEHERSLSYEEVSVFFHGDRPWGCGSDELWAWRGHIARKLLGRMPTAEEVSVPKSSAYWTPDLITEVQPRDSRGPVGPPEYRRRGKRLNPDSAAVRRFKASRARS